MDLTINETNRRRDKQKEYNKLNSIIPTQINKSNENDLLIGRKKESNEINDLVFTKDFSIEDPVVKNMKRSEIEKSIDNIKRMMENEAKKENFMQAAVLRDELFKYKKLLLEKFDD
jgi:excinuclease ABC subunit B